VRVRLVTIAVLTIGCGTGCAGEQTLCERTGNCVSFDAPGEPIAVEPPLLPASMFGAPVPDPLAISSTFGPRWKFSAQRDDFHLGVDYYGEPDTPLFAIGDGVVHGIFPEGSATFPLGGNVIVIEHVISERTFHDRPVDRFYAVYLHTQSMLVTTGQTVTRGQMIGTMGMTGDTDFVHLHFETRVATPCSLEFQADHPDCATGFDPHVHPFLFVGGENVDQLYLGELASRDGFVARYQATRGDLDLDAIETDFGTIDFDTREGLDAGSTATLDNFDFGYVRLVPVEFLSSSDSIAYELHFKDRPSYLEVRDIYGRGLRFGDRP
jgi:murein DD-endopeptidase MepM/ murein hydrolase activator NlpD